MDKQELPTQGSVVAEFVSRFALQLNDSCDLSIPSHEVLPCRCSHDANVFSRAKKSKIHRFFAIFSAFFPNIWPLAGPNIAKKGGPLQKLARVDRQTHFGTFNFWLKLGF